MKKIFVDSVLLLSFMLFVFCEGPLLLLVFPLEDMQTILSNLLMLVSVFLSGHIPLQKEAYGGKQEDELL